jgi:hypothetical protein
MNLVSDCARTAGPENMDTEIRENADSAARSRNDENVNKGFFMRFEKLGWFKALKSAQYFFKAPASAKIHKSFNKD